MRTAQGQRETRARKGQPAAKARKNPRAAKAQSEPPAAAVGPMDRKAPYPFWFSEYLLMPTPTGLRATNLREFLAHLRDLSEPALRYHLWESRLTLNPPTLEYPNDFALWAANALHDDKLAEKLSSVDPFEYENLTQVREAMVDLLEEYVWELAHNPQVLPGYEFNFCEGCAVVLHAGITVDTLREFCQGLQTVGLDSVYYHFVDARERLGDRKKDDFSHWIETNFDMPALVSDIRDIDVYFYTPMEIRDAVLALIQRHTEETCASPE